MHWLWLSVTVFLLDQWTKHLAGTLLQYGAPVPVFPGFNLTLVHNTGAAFSLLHDAGGWQRAFFILLAAGISVFLVLWLVRLPRGKHWLAAALALILGGAVGNLCDRLLLGHVVDFIDVYWRSWHWPAFNIADSAIFVGAVMLAIDAFWLESRRLKGTTGDK